MTPAWASLMAQIQLPAQTPVTPEVLERLLEATLGQLAAMGVVLLGLALIGFMLIFFRQQGLQKRQQELTENLSGKFYSQHDTMARQERILEQQTQLLSKQNDLIAESNKKQDLIIETNNERIKQNDTNAATIKEVKKSLDESGVYTMSELIKSEQTTDAERWELMFTKLQQIERKLDALTTPPAVPVATDTSATPEPPDPNEGLAKDTDDA